MRALFLRCSYSEVWDHLARAHVLPEGCHQPVLLFVNLPLVGMLYVCGCTRAPVHQQRSEDSFRELLLPPTVGPGNQAQVIRFESQALWSTEPSH